MPKFDGTWYFDCWTRRPWHGMSGTVRDVQARNIEEAESIISERGRQALERRGCAPMLITGMIHTRDVHESTRRW
jgi:hypothetical protein